MGGRGGLGPGAAMPSNPVGRARRQIRGPVTPRGERKGSPRGRTERIEAVPPRKASSEGIACPYRKPTQVGWSSRPRWAREPRSRNSANWPRNFGRRGAPRSVTRPCGGEREGAAVTRPRRLFTKNTGPCQRAACGRIGAETCPVPVGEGEPSERRTEAPVNGGRNYNGPKVAKFLVG